MLRPSAVTVLLLGGESPIFPRPMSSPLPINRTPVVVEAAPRSSTRARGVTELQCRLRLSGSAPEATSDSMTSTDALRTRLHSECSGVSPSLFFMAGFAPRCSSVFTTAAADLDVHTWMALCSTLFPAWSVAFTSAPSCASASIVATSSFSEPWKCSPDTARCSGSTERARSCQKSDLSESPFDLTTARMPCTSPSRMAAISWSVGEERRLGEDHGNDWRPPNRDRRTLSRSCSGRSILAPPPLAWLLSRPAPPAALG
mmetsp:Transcript_1507/g.2487  ORF Transcript_1507/g.2487 Transcript_1507/m.2487 type:complete len:258 (-) Transcript_1507:50-823(-)